MQVLFFFFLAQRACVAYIWLVFKCAFICITNTGRHIRIPSKHFVSYILFCRSLFVFTIFSIGHCIACPSSRTTSDYPFDIFKIFLVYNQSAACVPNSVLTQPLSNCYINRWMPAPQSLHIIDKLIIVKITIYGNMKHYESCRCNGESW